MQITEEMIRNIVAANSSNPYVDVTPYELGFGIPETKYQNFFRKKRSCGICSSCTNIQR